MQPSRKPIVSNDLKPPAAANRLVRIAQVFSDFHGLSRFPVNVEPLAYEAATVFGWSDPIKDIVPKDIKGFEGALFPDDHRKNWFLIFNDRLASPGRVRFTLAHELGHYILHRMQHDSFECSAADMDRWSTDEQNIEGQADLFASYLLMPADDFRSQLDVMVTFDMLGACAERYGVSLTAAILRWLSLTDQKALMVVSREGYIMWSWSSDAAFRSGAFFRTRGRAVELPRGSIAQDSTIAHERVGIKLPATTWFENADPAAYLHEMKLTSLTYDYVYTVLLLPKSLEVWPKRSS